MEDNCNNNATNNLTIDLTDRQETYSFCKEHYDAANKLLREIKEATELRTEGEQIERLRELLSPQEFIAIMEDIKKVGGCVN